jgi:hypothetical protein
MRDGQIRAALKSELFAYYSGDADTIIIDELGLRHGASRIDLVVVNGNLHGFELKSDRDTLERLPSQAKIYNSVFDFVSLVVGNRHFAQAFELVPDWWGIKRAEVQADGRVYLSELRPPNSNPSADPLAIAKLLWREEALAFLEELGQAKGLYSKPRAAIYARLVAVAGVEQIRSRVRRQLKDRTDWRPAGRRMSCGG